MKLATDKELEGVTFRVFFVILSEMDQFHFSPAVPTAIAENLSISPSAASRAVSKLVEKGFIQRRYFSEKSKKLIGLDVLIFEKKNLLYGE